MYKCLNTHTRQESKEVAMILKMQQQQLKWFFKKAKKVHTLKQNLTAETLINYATALSICATENNLSESWIAALIHQNIIKYAPRISSWTASKMTSSMTETDWIIISSDELITHVIHHSRQRRTYKKSREKESVHAEPDHITIRPVSGARDLAVADVHAIIPIHLKQFKKVTFRHWYYIASNYCVVSNQL